MEIRIGTLLEWQGVIHVSLDLENEGDAIQDIKVFHGQVPIILFVATNYLVVLYDF